MPHSFEVSHKPVRTVNDHPVAVVTPSGQTNAVATQAFDEACQAAIDGGAKSLVLDFGDVEYISSSGLKLLLKVRKQLINAGGRLRLACVRGKMRETVFDDLGFSRLLEIHPSVAEAEQACGE
jgi:anti-anti-sigma factor